MGNMVLRIDDVEPDRDTIEISGKSYELLGYEDFGLIDNARLRKNGQLILGDMGKLDELDEAGLRTFEDRIESMICRVLNGLEPEVAKALPYKHKAAILTAFWQAVVKRSQEAVTTADKQLNPTGETP